MLALGASLLAACGGGDAVGPDTGAATLVAEVTNLATLKPATEGSYQAWVVTRDGDVRSLGRFVSAGKGSQTLAFTTPVSNPAEFYITVEPPGDDNDTPYDAQILGGFFKGSSAELSYISRLTPGVPLIEEPGTHVLFTPSDNAALGYPSNEDAGIWLFEFGKDPEEEGGFWLDFASPDRGWTYEGWMVLDYGTPGAVWFSYGKFEADEDQKASSRDDTGLGPFSGQLEYRDAMPEEIVMPGDDWVANPLGVPLPGGLPDSILPLDLNGCADVVNAAGEILRKCREFWRGPSRFTHVITMEPLFDKGEDPWAAQPFFLELYKNPVGEGSPATKRKLIFQPQNLPAGTARVESGA